MGGVYSKGGGCCIVSYVTDVIYDNEMLQQPELLKWVKSSYGSDALLKLINLGSDSDVSDEINSAIQAHGLGQVLDVIFGYGDRELSECDEDTPEIATASLLIGNSACGSMEA